MQKKSNLQKGHEIVVETYLESQRESEEKFLELEEKRMKLEFETERRRMEMDERRRESDHKHELKMWRMMMQMMNNPPTGYHPSLHSQQPYHQNLTQRLSNFYPNSDMN